MYLAEAAVSKIFPSRENALKNDMLKEESKKFMSAAIYVSATFAFGMGLFFIASEILIKWNF